MTDKEAIKGWRAEREMRLLYCGLLLFTLSRKIQAMIR
jgi:hypothetical protein